jgi:uncharacterized repeat protein (TIGR03806 family)
LSELGLFEGAPAAQIPRAGLLPYEVNAPLFSDGAKKRRFVLVPPGARLTTSADRWQLPVGTYLVKTFSFPLDQRNPALGERLVETRFLVRTEAGFSASTYVWNAEQTDALASEGDLDVPVSFIDQQGIRRRQTFHVPGPSECAACHEGRALGFRTRQLDHAASYPDGTHDQLAHWAKLGVISAPPPVGVVLVDPFGEGGLAERARSYLDANCSHCHGEGGSAERTDLFWGFEYTDPKTQPTCRETRSVDGRDHVLVPGHPEQSEFLARMLSQSPRVHMPRGTSLSVDRTGVALLSAWVRAMPARACD